jgi:hypothetical protein
MVCVTVASPSLIRLRLNPPEATKRFEDLPETFEFVDLELDHRRKKREEKRREDEQGQKETERKTNDDVPG